MAADSSTFLALNNSALFVCSQAGAEILVVHPDYLLATLEPAAFDRYVRLRAGRQDKAFRYQQGAYSDRHTLLQVRAPHRTWTIVLATWPESPRVVAKCGP